MNPSVRTGIVTSANPRKLSGFVDSKLSILISWLLATVYNPPSTIPCAASSSEFKSVLSFVMIDIDLS